MAFNKLHRSVLHPEQPNFELTDIPWLFFFFFWPSQRAYTLTVSITGLLDILPHNVTFIWKTLVEPESMSHVFFLPSFSPVLSTSHFFASATHKLAHPFICFSFSVSPRSSHTFSSPLQTGPLWSRKKFSSPGLRPLIWPAFWHQARRGDPCVQGGFCQGAVHLDSSAGGGLPQRC